MENTLHTKQQITDYERIAAAISYITENFKQQPRLDEVAKQVHLSPFHFQRLFTQWAGVSPKKYVQYLTINYAKQALQQKKATLFDAAFNAGLSGTGRLHHLFVTIEAMTPGEYKLGAALPVNYSFESTPFGRLLIASTAKGICYAAFTSNDAAALQQLQQQFPAASLTAATDSAQQAALKIFDGSTAQSPVALHVKGSAFQLKIWEALLRIPTGALTTYKTIAGQSGSPQAVRAVGTAIGQNPVAFIIPCHRVIQSSGGLGGYRWSTVRKQAMIGWEAAKIEVAE